MLKCGQKPGIGRYVCKNCGEDLFLDDDTDRLPPCARCHKCEFTSDDITISTTSSEKRVSCALFHRVG